MTKNRPVDLNNILYEQLERLNDEDLSDEKVVVEISRAKALTGLASQIVANNNMVLSALRTQMRATDMGQTPSLPSALSGRDDDHE